MMTMMLTMMKNAAGGPRFLHRCGFSFSLFLLDRRTRKKGGRGHRGTSILSKVWACAVFFSFFFPLLFSFSFCSFPYTDLYGLCYLDLVRFALGMRGHFTFWGFASCFALSCGWIGMRGGGEISLPWREFFF